MTFEVGDKVIYPNHGLGIVERIEEKTILGTTCGFYHLRIVANDTTVLVPVTNVDGVGLRRAITDHEVERPPPGERPKLHKIVIFRPFPLYLVRGSVIL